MDIYGRDVIVGNGLTFSSDLSNRMKKVVDEVNGKLYVRNDKKSLPILDEVIEKYPNFPFGYFAKFNILKVFGDPAKALVNANTKKICNNETFKKLVLRCILF